MKWMQLLLPVVVLAGAAFPAEAQLFSRKVRLNGMQVPELIVVVRTDTDERKRIAAIEQLREFDVKANPEIIANLVEVMRGDPKYSVRMEAMHSLVKIRPMTPQVAQALQQTAAQDDNWRVRTQTKTQIWLNAYYPGNSNNPGTVPAAPTTKEPPLSNLSNGTITGQPLYVSPSQPVNVPSTPGQTIYSYSTPNAGTPPALPRPLPSRPATSPGYSTAVPLQPGNEPPMQPPLPQIPPAPQQQFAPAPLPQAPAPLPQAPAPLPQAPAPLPNPPPSTVNEPAVIPVTPPVQ